jgi:hypothetical protein
VARATTRGVGRVGDLRTAHAALLRIAHLLDPDDQSASGAAIRAQVEAVLDEIIASIKQVPPWLEPALLHMTTILRRLGPDLYRCYDIPGLPRTDNDLEHFYRRLKAGERRITGRKRSDTFVVQVGGFAVYATAAAFDPEDDLEKELSVVSAGAWQRERASLRAIQERQTKMRRFHLHRATYLADLETRWTQLSQPP